MTAVIYASFIVALLIIARLIVSCRGLLKERLRTDPLTSLPTRQGFEETVAANLKSGGPLTIVWLGLDGFRRINELRGYAGGDAILAAVGPLIRRHLRPGDTVARFGGDQFLMMLRGHEPAIKITDRILRAMEASAGISLFPNHADNATELLELAETALGEAKVTARGKALVYRPSMAANGFRSTAVSDLIRSALAHDRFRLVYQPIVDLTCEIVRMQAFVRMDDPDLGRIPASAFIGVAEQTGLIHEIGAWVLRNACQQARKWHDAGFPILMSVNMSPLQLASETLADGIISNVAGSGLPPSALAIEVTGTIRSGAPIERLRSAGIRMFTQQWGEENTLFDGIRIKAPFKLPANKPEHLIVIAQGIEDPAQLDQAQAAGCHLFQGFQIAPPLEPEDATEILRAGRVGQTLSPVRKILR